MKLLINLQKKLKKFLNLNKKINLFLYKFPEFLKFHSNLITFQFLSQKWVIIAKKPSVKISFSLKFEW